MKYNYLLLLFLAVFFVGCSDDDEDITPTQEDEMFYLLPQGNHDYDKTIVSWRDNYGFYAVYRFDIGDMYWNNTSWQEYMGPLVEDTGDLYAVQGDTTDDRYIGRLVEMIDTYFLKNYKDEWLKECMPLRVFLCSQLGGITSVQAEDGTGTIIGYDTTRLWTRESYGCLAINGASAEILDFEDTATELDSMITEFYSEINSWFVSRLMSSGLIEEIGDDFLSVSNSYYNAGFGATNTGETKFDRGFLSRQTCLSTISKEEMISRDISNYLHLVFNYSWEQLTDYPCYFDAPGRPSQYPSMEEYQNYIYNYDIYQDNSNSPSLLSDYTGILNPLRDKHGRCFSKFIAMKDYIQNVIGLDLSRIHFPNGEEPVYELPEEDSGE